MICPVCKNIIKENTLICPHCKKKIGLVCKTCNTVNAIGNLTCKICGTELIKVCEHCKSLNNTTARVCRKCGKPLNNKKSDDFQSILNKNIKLYSQKDAIKILESSFEQKKMISLCGDSGIGKNFVLNNAIANLQDVVLMFGRCTAKTQLIPGGVVRDIFLNLLNLPEFFFKQSGFENQVKSFLKKEFSKLNNEEINTLLNFFYADKEADFDNIISARKNIFALIFKLLDKISKIGQIVIVVDNFDFIDGFSAEFFEKLFAKGMPVHLIILYRETNPPIYTSEYLNIKLNSLNEEDMWKICNNFVGIDEANKKWLIDKSQGNPNFLKHLLLYFEDCRNTGKTFILPASFEQVIEDRLKLLKENDEFAYKFVLAASIFGDKFDINLLNNILKFNGNRLNSVIEALIQKQFIMQINNTCFEFTNSYLWEVIVKIIQKSKQDFVEINKNIFDFANEFIFNSNILLLLSSQNMQQNSEVCKYWIQLSELSAAVGDTQLYSLSLKQALALMNESDDENLIQRFNIYENLGKILSYYASDEATEFLANAIVNAQQTNDAKKEIELSSYLANCCLKASKYYGNIECVDNVLSKTSLDNKLQRALLLTCKLKSLLFIGNCGEVVNIIDNDIMPVFDKFLSKSYKTEFSYNFVWEVWLQTYIILANALTLQGNCERAFDILKAVWDIIEKNKIDNFEIRYKTKLILALANTVKGNFEFSEHILNEISDVCQSDFNDLILFWNLTDIFNKFLKGDYAQLRKQLYECSVFAQDLNKKYAKTLLNMLLGKVFMAANKEQSALKIYNSQVTYFVTKKLGLGALLGWYLIADAMVKTMPYQTIDVSQRAIDIAQNPKINNLLFIVLFHMLIARACVEIKDFETAQINFESAVKKSDNLKLNDLSARLYLSYGQCFYKAALLSLSADDAVKAYKLYEKASKFNENNANLSADIEQSKQDLLNFCQSHQISLQ